MTKKIRFVSAVLLLILNWTTFANALKRKKVNETVKASVLAQNDFKEAYRPYVVYDDYKSLRNITERTSLSYCHGKISYELPDLAFDPQLLTQIKQKAHFKLNDCPNVARYLLRIHYTEGTKNKVKTFDIISDEVFLCGGKFFYKHDSLFKKTHHILDAFHDFLSAEERKHFLKESPETKGIYLGKLMEAKVRNLVGGAWKNNCTHSETLLLLHLADQMKTHLEEFVEKVDPKSKKIELHGMVLQISSYRDLCWRCRNLVQGFQWQLEPLIFHCLSQMKIQDKICIHENFSTLAVTVGQTPCKTPDYLPPKLFETNATLEVDPKQANRQHKLIIVHRYKNDTSTSSFNEKMPIN